MSEGQDQEKEQLEAPKELTIDQVRSKVVQDFSLDEIEQEELIDKLVNERIDHHKKLSKAIQQKIAAREGKEDNKKTPVELDDEVIDKKLDERLEKRELERLSLSDDLKKEVQSYAKINNVSISEAMKSSYIQFKKGEEDTKRRNEEAAAGGEGAAVYTEDDLSKEPNFDLRTEAGKKKKEAWEAKLKKELG